MDVVKGDTQIWEHDGSEHRLLDDKGVILAKVYECSDGLLFTPEEDTPIHGGSGGVVGVTDAER